ncbi:MAG TPA: ornithine cyclodeaminase family protein [Micromonosporaceae bacterium]|jgi:ornithine cyclodeaminase
MFTLLCDEDVRDALSAAEAVELMRAALIEHHRGALRSPARLRADLGDGGLMVTAGRQVGTAYGMRVYGTFPHSTEQVTVVFDESNGRITAIITGNELGDRRTGALGGVAIDLLARADAGVLAVLGTGRQAWTQIWAATAVRSLVRIRVYGRDHGRCRAFAARCEQDFAIESTPTTSAVAAVGDADIIVLSTTSETPVIEDGWVRPGVHITTVGPKTVDAHECPRGYADRAAPVATDSLAQLVAYGAPPLVPAERVVALGAIAAGARAGRTDDDDSTLFLSTGLAGTEIVFANRILARDRGC